jgi:hypothetical protein
MSLGPEILVAQAPPPCARGAIVLSHPSATTCAFDRHWQQGQAPVTSALIVHKCFLIQGSRGIARWVPEQPWACEMSTQLIEPGDGLELTERDGILDYIFKWVLEPHT